MAYGVLISINGQHVTDQGRELSEPIEIRGVTNELATGSLRRYVKAIKKNWTLTFQWLPGKSVNTTDGGLGRDGLLALAKAISSHTMTINRTGGAESYIVIVDSYEETLLRRDPILDESFYNVTLGLKEV